MKTKKNRFSILFIIFILLMTGLACLSTTNNEINNNQENDSNTPDLEATTAAIQKTQEALETAPTEVPAVPEEIPVDPEFTYYTDFSDLDDWIYMTNLDDLSNYELDNSNPGLYIQVLNPSDWISIYYDEIWREDVRIEIEFEFISGPDDSYIEFYCRANNDVETSFSIASDGYWVIGFMDYSDPDYEFNTLASGQSSLYDGVNFAVAYCEGEDLSLYINGDFEGETSFSEIYEGGIGVSVLTYDGGGAEWYVSYFYEEDIN